MIIYTSSTRAYAPLATLTTSTKVDYANRHGYSFVFDALPEDCRIERIGRVVKHLDGDGSDWLMFTGADVLLTNLTIPLEDLIDAEADCIIGIDRLGINDDVVLVRRCPQVKSFFEKIVHGLKVSPANSQEIVRFLLSTNQDINTPMPPERGIGYAGVRFKLVHQRNFNSFQYGLYPHHPDSMAYDPALKSYRCGNWQSGDFALHLPFLPMDVRTKVLKDYLPKVVR